MVVRENKKMSAKCPLIQYLDALIHFGNKQSEWIKQHGRHWEPQSLPEAYERGELGNCFNNAFTLATGDFDLTYVEGIASGIIPTNHAWVVDKEGNVIDSTWENPAECVYYGIPFDIKYVIRSTFDRGYFGLIDNWQEGWPLVRGEHGGPEVWLHEDYRE